MKLARSTWICLGGLAAAVGLLAYWSAASPNDPTQRAGLRQLPALQLPRTRTVPGSPRDFEWAAGVAEAVSMYFPAEMPVFGVVRSAPKESAAAAAALFGERLSTGSDNSSTDIEDRYAAAVGDLEIEGFADGNYSVQHRDRHPLQSLRNWDDQAPGTNETIALADKYLEEHPGLLPAGARLVEVVPIGTMGDFVRVRGAVFRRFHNGFPEGSFAVGVNTNGEVCMVSRNMRDLDLVGDYPILSPTEAAGLLNSPAATRHGLDAVDIEGPARIDRVEMEYWDGATAWQLGSIQPVYRFIGTVHNAAGDQGSFTVTVPAVRPEYTTPVELPRTRGTSVRSVQPPARGNQRAR